MRFESERLIKLANKNRLTKALKTKLAFGLGALYVPLNMAAGDQGFKGKETADWVKKNPGTYAKNLAVDTALSATPMKGSVVGKVIKGTKALRTTTQIPTDKPAVKAAPKPPVKPKTQAPKPYTPPKPPPQMDRMGPPPPPPPKLNRIGGAPPASPKLRAL